MYDRNADTIDDTFSFILSVIVVANALIPSSLSVQDIASLFIINYTEIQMYTSYAASLKSEVEKQLEQMTL